MSSFIVETTALLERTPELLRTLLVGLPEAWTGTPDIDGGWRPREVVGHLGILLRRDDPSAVGG